MMDYECYLHNIVDNFVDNFGEIDDMRHQVQRLAL